MNEIIVTFGGIAVLCASGFVVSTALKWFHTYEVDVDEIKRGSKRKNIEHGGDSHESRINNISKRLQSKS